MVSRNVSSDRLVKRFSALRPDLSLYCGGISDQAKARSVFHLPSSDLTDNIRATFCIGSLAWHRSFRQSQFCGRQANAALLTVAAIARKRAAISLFTASTAPIRRNSSSSAATLWKE